jgi:hypothetical protein
MLFGSVFPLSHRKYAVLRPTIPLPRMTVVASELSVVLIVSNI